MPDVRTRAEQLAEWKASRSVPRDEPKVVAPAEAGAKPKAKREAIAKPANARRSVTTGTAAAAAAHAQGVSASSRREELAKWRQARHGGPKQARPRQSGVDTAMDQSLTSCGSPPSADGAPDSACLRARAQSPGEVERILVGLQPRRQPLFPHETDELAMNSTPSRAKDLNRGGAAGSGVTQCDSTQAGTGSAITAAALEPPTPSLLRYLEPSF